MRGQQTASWFGWLAARLPGELLVALAVSVSPVRSALISGSRSLIVAGVVGVTGKPRPDMLSS